MAEAAPSLATLLEDFTKATTTSQAALTRDPQSLQPPTNGISLLDTKNEIFLAYVQALALRNLEVLRQFKTGGDFDATSSSAAADDSESPAKHPFNNEQVVRKLVELRVYLEKGVRPLESRLKFRLDRVIKTADEEDTRAARALQAKQKQLENPTVNDSDSDSNSENSSSEADDDDNDNDPTSFRPNVSLLLPSQPPSTLNQPTTRKPTPSTSNTLYRPPRISATTMDPDLPRPSTRAQRTPRSATLDEYIHDELSTAPVAQPSIGSTITAGGRLTKTPRQLRDEAERRTYEETNLVRLPAQSKAERNKMSGRAAREGGFGGEEWRDLGASVDRIAGLTRKGSGRGRGDVLERSRKRAVEDGPRGDGRGVEHGRMFEMKRRKLAGKGRI